jgi:hypothetical protein
MRYNNLQIFASPPGMFSVTPLNMDNFKFSGPRMHYNNSAHRDSHVYQYERLRRNDLTN